MIKLENNNTIRGILRKLRLIEDMTITLAISKIDFVQHLRSITDDAEIGIFYDILDIFSPSKNKLKGQVHTDGFTIKTRRHFFIRN